MAPCGAREVQPRSSSRPFLRAAPIEVHGDRDKDHPVVRNDLTCSELDFDRSAIDQKLNRRILPSIGRRSVVMGGNAFHFPKSNLVCSESREESRRSNITVDRPADSSAINGMLSWRDSRGHRTSRRFQSVSCWRIDLTRNLDSVRAPADSVDGERETRFRMRSRSFARRPKLRPRTSGRRRSKMDRLVEFAYRLPPIV